MIQILAVLFIVYEITKILFPEKYIKLLMDMGNFKVTDDKATNSQELKKALISKYSIVFVIEVIYLIFVASLLFTASWFVGLLLITLALVYKKRLNNKSMIHDSVISIIVLMLIFIV